MRLTLLAVLFALSPAVLEAQLTGPIPINPQPITGELGAVVEPRAGVDECSQPGVCAVFPGGTIVAYAFEIAGTFVGTLQFEATIDTQTWRVVQMVNLSTGGSSATATSNGAYTLSNVGFATLRLRAVAWTSGTALVSMRRGYASYARSGGTNPTPTVTQVTIQPDIILKGPGSAVVRDTLGIYRLDGTTFAGGLMFGVLASTLPQPTCSVTTRGLFWSSFGALGVKDNIAVCAKSGTDGYAWRTIY